MNKRPVRLGKVEDKGYPYNYLLDRVEEWLLCHSTLCLIILLALLSAFFVMLCFAIIGVSATDSGIYCNHLQDVI